MYAAHELSQAVRTRRREIGLSQQALARMAGLSRATINQLERGALNDLSLTRTAAVLDVLGLGLTISPPHPFLRTAPGQATPLELAARTASVSYARTLTPAALHDALSTAEMASEFEPHLAALLEEAPMPLLAKAVEQVHAESRLPRETVWGNIRAMAARLQLMRGLWHAEG